MKKKNGRGRRLSGHRRKSNRRVGMEKLMRKTKMFKEMSMVHDFLHKTERMNRMQKIATAKKMFIKKMKMRRNRRFDSIERLKKMMLRVGRQTKMFESLHSYFHHTKNTSEKG